MTGLCVVALLAVHQDFDLAADSLAPILGEMSAEQAYTRVRDLERTAPLPDNGARPRLCLQEFRGNRTWLWETDGGCDFVMDSLSGDIVRYNDKAKHLPGAVNRATDPFQNVIGSESSIRARLLELARVFGLPEGAKSGLLLNGSVADKGWFSPLATLQFSLLHHGREILGRWGSVTVDLRDSAPVAAERHYGYSVLEEEPVLSSVEADAKATRAMLDRERDTNSPELIYYPVDKRDVDRKVRVTVCYRVSFTRGVVFVDAVTGAILQVSKA